MSAFTRLSDLDNRIKHLEDAVQILAVSNDGDFSDRSAAMTKRLRWLEEELRPQGRGWDRVQREQRLIVSERLRRALR
jgi:predicted secreted Zn-dependent protease